MGKSRPSAAQEGQAGATLPSFLCLSPGFSARRFLAFAGWWRGNRGFFNPKPGNFSRFGGAGWEGGQDSRELTLQSGRALWGKDVCGSILILEEFQVLPGEWRPQKQASRSTSRGFRNLHRAHRPWLVPAPKLSLAQLASSGRQLLYSAWSQAERVEASLPG